MNALKFRRMTYLLALLMIMGACNYPPPPAPVEQIPTCSPNTLVSPTLLSPSKLETTLDPRPEFRWTYPPQCNPDQFIIEVVLHPLAGEFAVEAKAEVNGSRRSWVIDEPLSEGKALGWRVSAVSGGVRGPDEGYMLFFSGPLCETSSLNVPVLGYPKDGTFIEQGALWMRWRYPEACLPDTYVVDLSASPDFSGKSLVADASIPIQGATPLRPLEDCTQYFWRVAAQKEGILGPFTPTASFWTNFSGECELGSYTGSD